MLLFYVKNWIFKHMTDNFSGDSYSLETPGAQCPSRWSCAGTAAAAARMTSSVTC